MFIYIIVTCVGETIYCDQFHFQPAEFHGVLNTVLGAYFLPIAMYFAKKPISKHIILITPDLITAALLCYMIK